MRSTAGPPPYRRVGIARLITVATPLDLPRALLRGAESHHSPRRPANCVPPPGKLMHSRSQSLSGRSWVRYSANLSNSPPRCAWSGYGGYDPAHRKGHCRFATLMFMLWDRDELKKTALTPEPLDQAGFNYDCELPHGLAAGHVRDAMQDFIDFLGFLNAQLHSKEYERLESMLEPATFSGMVGEFMNSVIPNLLPDVVEEPLSQRTPRPDPCRTLPGGCCSAWDRGHRGKGVTQCGAVAGAQPRKVLAYGIRIRKLPAF